MPKVKFKINIELNYNFFNFSDMEEINMEDLTVQNTGPRKAISFNLGDRYKYSNPTFGLNNSQDNIQKKIIFTKADSTIKEDKEPNDEERQIRELREDNIMEKIRNERVNNCLKEAKDNLAKANVDNKRINAEKNQLAGKVGMLESALTDKFNEIIAKNMEIKILKLKIKNTEMELSHTALRVFGEAEDIAEGSSSSVRFTKTMAGYSVFNTDAGALELIRMLNTFSHCHLDKKPSDFYVKKEKNGGQMTFGVIDGLREIGNKVECIICKRVFNDGKSYKVNKGPFGVAMDNDEQKIRYGPLCGSHKNGSDTMIKPINFYIPRN